MAITKIWAVKSHLHELLRYVGDKNKTTIDTGVANLIGYETDEYKTEERLYVTGINCTAENAPELMSKLLSRNQNKSDRVTYHAVQSFSGKECTPETALAIGREFAMRMWGDNFPVVVAVHKNTDNVHVHYAICASGFDGKRLHADGTMRHKMMDINDELCRENGLSVCPNRSWGHRTDFFDKKMAERGKKSIRAQIREAVDHAIHMVGSYGDRSFESFWYYLEQMGFVMEQRGKYLRVRPDEGERFIRLESLGENYTKEAITRRIYERYREYMDNREDSYEDLVYHYKYRDRSKGIYGIWLHYLYLINHLPKTYTRNEAVNNALRADREKARRYSDEADMLGRHHIETDEDLQRFCDGEVGKLSEKTKERQALRNKLRRMHNSEEMEPIKAMIAVRSREIAKHRKNIELCRDVAKRSEVVLYVSKVCDYEHHCIEDRYYAEENPAPRLSKKAEWWFNEQAALGQRKIRDKRESGAADIPEKEDDRLETPRRRSGYER